MFDIRLGNNRDDSPSLNPPPASSLDFLLALQAFLGQNQIDFIGRYGIQIENTSSNNLRLVVVGDIRRSDCNGPDQRGLGSGWPSAPSSSNGFSANEAAAASSGAPPSASFGVPSPEWDTNVMRQCQQSATGILNDSLTASESIFSSNSRSFLIETGEAQSISPPLLDCITPKVVDLPISPPPTGSLDNADSHENDSPWAECNACTSPEFGSGSTMDTSSWRVEGLASRSRSSSGSRSRKRTRSSTSLLDPAELMVQNLVHNILCDDFYSFLESELPRWIKEGLGHVPPKQFIGPGSSSTLAETTASRNTPPPQSSYSKLEQAYLAVCELHSRMSGDLVRSRIALIQLHVEFTEMNQGRRSSSATKRIESTVGRGHASHVIDLILENIHGGWKTLNQRKRAELRAKFHERKKYGKRWAQLANSLGPGILLICSTKLANAVRSATASAKTLDAVIECFKDADSDAMKILRVINPLAGCLVKNEDFKKFEATRILRQLHHHSQRLRGGSLQPP